MNENNMLFCELILVERVVDIIRYCFKILRASLRLKLDRGFFYGDYVG